MAEAKSTATRGAVVVSGLVIAAAVLAGCAAEPPSSTASPAQTGIMESAAPPTTAPELSSRLGLSCAGLLPDALVAATVATGLSAVEFTANPGYATPAAYSVAQRGGTACSTSNGVVPQPGGTAPGYRGVTVLVLPDALAQWDRYASIYKYVISGADAAYGDAAAVVCFGRGAQSSCTANILVGTVWIDVVIDGITADADADDPAVAARVQPLLARVTHEVSRAGAPAQLWLPLSGTADLPADCAGFLSGVEIAETLSLSNRIDIGDSAGGWSLMAAAAEDAQVDRCFWFLDGSESIAGSSAALHGGAWAFDRSSSILAPTGVIKAVTEPIAGVDRATFGCGLRRGECTLDTVIAGNWVQLNAEQGPVAETGDLEARLSRLAALVAERING